MARVGGANPQSHRASAGRQCTVDTLGGTDLVGFSSRMRLNAGVCASVAIVTLALGIGAVTIIYSVIHNVVVDPLQYRDADRLVNVFVENVQSGAVAQVAHEIVQKHRTEFVAGALSDPFATGRERLSRQWGLLVASPEVTSLAPFAECISTPPKPPIRPRAPSSPTPSLAPGGKHVGVLDRVKVTLAGARRWRDLDPFCARPSDGICRSEAEWTNS
jgi:hypothetical protein